MYEAALTVVAAGVTLRALGVVGAFVRTFLARRRFVTFRMGWIELATLPEPLVLLAAVWVLERAAVVPAVVTPAALAAAVGGAVLVLIGWALLVWAFFSWRSLFAGHGVLQDHRLVTSGAYGLVRHPVYLGVFLKWLGLALAYRSPGTLLVTVLYVIPVYLAYLRSEEVMMHEHFGEPYRAYQEQVPMLLPGAR